MPAVADYSPIDYLNPTNPGDLDYQRYLQTQALDKQLEADMLGYGGDLDKIQQRQLRYGQDRARLNANLDRQVAAGRLDPNYAVNASAARQQAGYNATPYTQAAPLYSPEQETAQAEYNPNAVAARVEQQDALGQAAVRADEARRGVTRYAQPTASARALPQSEPAVSGYSGGGNTQTELPKGAPGSTLNANYAKPVSPDVAGPGEPLGLSPASLAIWRNAPDWQKADPAFARGLIQSVQGAENGYQANNALTAQQTMAARSIGQTPSAPARAQADQFSSDVMASIAPRGGNGGNPSNPTGRSGYTDYLDQLGKNNADWQRKQFNARTLNLQGTRNQSGVSFRNGVPTVTSSFQTGSDIAPSAAQLAAIGGGEDAAWR